MTLKELINRVRQYTRDITGSLFTQEDIVAFINEGIDRTRRYKYFKGMEYLNSLSDEPMLLPPEYHHLLAIYGASRCFTQDEQNYLAQQFMNEYEYKTSEMEQLINDGELIIEGFDESSNKPFDAVKDVYFTKFTLGGE